MAKSKSIFTEAVEYLAALASVAAILGVLYFTWPIRGAIEAADTSMLSSNDDRRLIPSTGLENDLIAALPRLLRTQREIGAECPVVAMVSLIGVRDFELAVNPRLRSSWQRTAIDRDDLLIAEVVIEDWDAEPATTLRPIFDSIWQATGWPRSMNYDEQGRRNGV